MEPLYLQYIEQMYLYIYPSIILFGKITSVSCLWSVFFLFDHQTFQHYTMPS